MLNFVFILGCLKSVLMNTDMLAKNDEFGVSYASKVV